MAYSKPIYLFLVSFLMINVQSVLAGKEEDDEYIYWKKREDEAKTVAEASYILDPFTVTNSFNRAVDNAVGAKNITGRSLRPIYTGPCRATNPIDRCWRCRADWASNRQRLASCAKGFGRKAYGGGRRGEIYVVTDSRDDDMINPRYGTLRWGVIQEKPLWIVFAHDMVIRLQQELIMASHKTIDGRGANVHIAFGAGITIQFVTNIIIHGLNLHNLVPREGGIIRDSLSHMGIRTRSDGDAISVFGSSNIWLDHLSLRSCADGLIDVIMRSTAVTISNNHFSQHNDVMLLGASDQFDGDSIMQVTVAFNTFGRRLVQRMPRVRWGFAHVVNNDYRNWEMYAIGGSSHPTIISQGNRFTAPNNPNAKEITKRDYAADNVWASWNWTSEGDLYRNGAFFRPSGVRSSRLLTKDFDRHDVFKAKPGSFVTRLTRFSGALVCKVGAPC